MGNSPSLADSNLVVNRITLGDHSPCGQFVGDQLLLLVDENHVNDDEQTVAFNENLFDLGLIAANIGKYNNNLINKKINNK